MDGQLTLVIMVIAVALAFDFLNGFHDAANSIATVVSTRVLSPRNAVLLAAICNFAAAFFLETKVASTIGNDIVHQEFLDPYMVMFGLLGAIIWDLITWWYRVTHQLFARAGGRICGSSGRESGMDCPEASGLSQNSAIHRDCSDCGAGARPPHDAADELSLSESLAAQCGSFFSQRPACLRFHIQFQPRHE